MFDMKMKAISLIILIMLGVGFLSGCTEYKANPSPDIPNEPQAEQREISVCIEKVYLKEGYCEITFNSGYLIFDTKEYTKLKQYEGECVEINYFLYFQRDIHNSIISIFIK